MFWAKNCGCVNLLTNIMSDRHHYCESTSFRWIDIIIVTSVRKMINTNIIILILAPGQLINGHHIVIQKNDLTRCGFICFFPPRSRCRELEFVNGVFLLLSCHNLRDVIIGIDIAIPVMSLGSKLCHLIASDSSHERCHY